MVKSPLIWKNALTWGLIPKNFCVPIPKVLVVHHHPNAYLGSTSFDPGGARLRFMEIYSKFVAWKIMVGFHRNYYKLLGTPTARWFISWKIHL